MNTSTFLQGGLPPSTPHKSLLNEAFSTNPCLNQPTETCCFIKDYTMVFLPANSSRDAVPPETAKAMTKTNQPILTTTCSTHITCSGSLAPRDPYVLNRIHYHEHRPEPSNATRSDTTKNSSPCFSSFNC